MGNKVLAILFLYWYWYGPYLYQKVLILVLVILFEPKSIEYFSAILFPGLESSAVHAEDL